MTSKSRSRRRVTRANLSLSLNDDIFDLTFILLQVQVIDITQGHTMHTTSSTNIDGKNSGMAHSVRLG